MLQAKDVTENVRQFICGEDGSVSVVNADIVDKFFSFVIAAISNRFGVIKTEEIYLCETVIVNMDKFKFVPMRGE